MKIWFNIYVIQQLINNYVHVQIIKRYFVPIFHHPSPSPYSLRAVCKMWSVQEAALRKVWKMPQEECALLRFWNSVHDTPRGVCRRKL
jgi:hypothetical protein